MKTKTIPIIRKETCCGAKKKLIAIVSRLITIKWIASKRRGECPSFDVPVSFEGCESIPKDVAGCTHGMGWQAFATDGELSDEPVTAIYRVI